MKPINFDLFFEPNISYEPHVNCKVCGVSAPRPEDVEHEEWCPVGSLAENAVGMLQDSLKLVLNNVSNQYEMYAVTHKDHNYKTTYTHQKGKLFPPQPGGYNCSMIELLGGEIDVLRPFVGSKRLDGCVYFCKEDGCCGCGRAGRLSKIQKQTLPPLSDEFLMKIVKYYEHLHNYPQQDEQELFNRIKKWYNG